MIFPCAAEKADEGTERRSGGHNLGDHQVYPGWGHNHNSNILFISNILHYHI